MIMSEIYTDISTYYNNNLKVVWVEILSSRSRQSLSLFPAAKQWINSSREVINTLQGYTYVYNIMCACTYRKGQKITNEFHHRNIIRRKLIPLKLPLDNITCAFIFCTHSLWSCYSVLMISLISCPFALVHQVHTTHRKHTCTSVLASVHTLSRRCITVQA